ncbi:hypothetical protein K438DRAFT_2058579 [Mycena galopus ATCC 62051]|nr:hypothetical protein K438DRAFT_2058579 [Mycena galopus ATCC 62051]
MSGTLSVVRWARLRLPNGQIARSLWKQKRRPLDKTRMSRNIKIVLDGDQIAEVQFFFRAQIQGEAIALALVNLFSSPDEEFLHESYETVWSCAHGQGTHQLVIPVKTILFVVSMIPHSIVPGVTDK